MASTQGGHVRALSAALRTTRGAFHLGRSWSLSGLRISVGPYPQRGTSSAHPIGPPPAVGSGDLRRRGDALHQYPELLDLYLHDVAGAQPVVVIETGAVRHRAHADHHAGRERADVGEVRSDLFGTSRVFRGVPAVFLVRPFARTSTASESGSSSSGVTSHGPRPLLSAPSPCTARGPVPMILGELDVPRRAVVEDQVARDRAVGPGDERELGLDVEILRVARPPELVARADHRRGGCTCSTASSRRGSRARARGPRAARASARTGRARDARACAPTAGGAAA